MPPLKHTIVLLGAATFLSLAVGASAETITTTTGDLLRAPAQFDGQRVFVTGYYIGDVCDSRLFANKDRVGNYVWIDQSVWANPAERNNDRVIIGVSVPADLTEHYVRLIGTFRCRRTNEVHPSFGCAFDWTGLSPYAITNVTYFRPSKQR